MIIKRIFTILFLCLLTIQFNITSCSTGTDSGDNGGNGTAPVNDPTNNYQVVGEIISVGGLGGCSVGSVANLQGTVTDADFKINNAVHYFIDYGLYADTLYGLTYVPGTNYSLNVSHMGQVIASGTAKMPSIPSIANLNSIQNHSLNTALTVTWQPVQAATSIQVVISGDITNPVNQEYIYREYESPLINPNNTSFSIPDTFFAYPGEYFLGIIAYHGINPDFNILNIDQSGYLKSYNMEGATGVFLTACLSSEDGESLIVGSGLPKTSPSETRKKFKDLIIEKHRKYFGGFLNK